MSMLARCVLAALCAAWLSGIAQAACLAEDRGAFAELESLAYRAPDSAMPQVMARLAGTPTAAIQQRAQLSAIAADASRQLGLSRQALAYADAGLALLPSGDQSDLALRMRTLRALVSTNLGGIDAAITELTGIVERTDQRPLALGCILRDRGWLHFRQGDAAPALGDLTRAYALLRQHSTPEEAMVAAGRLSMAHYAARNYAVALALVDESIEFFRTEGAGVRLATALDRRASILKSAGRLDEALAAANEALRVHTEIGDRVGTGLSQLRLCGVEIERREYDRANDWCDAAEATLERSQGMDDNDHRTLAALRGRMAAAQQQPAQAIKQLTIALTAGGALPADDIASLFDLRARAYAEVGDYAAAFRDQSEFLQRVRTQSELDRIREIASLRVQFDMDREEQKNALLAADKTLAEERLVAQQRFTQLAIGAGFTFFCAALALGYALWSKRRHNSELTALAERDELTRLPNRRKILATASDLLARVRQNNRSAVIGLIDLDHFKHVNDRFGHEVGDDTLRRFAALARASLRAGDRLGRYGGEEFLLLLPDTSLAEALPVVDRLRVALQELPMCAGEPEPMITTLSCGLATLDPGDQSFDAPLRRADVALYAAKRAGRNRIECYRTAAPDDNASTPVPVPAP